MFTYFLGRGGGGIFRTCTTWMYFSVVIRWKVNLTFKGLFEHSFLFQLSTNGLSSKLLNFTKISCADFETFELIICRA